MRIIGVRLDISRLSQNWINKKPEGQWLTFRRRFLLLEAFRDFPLEAQDPGERLASLAADFKVGANRFLSFSGAASGR